MFQALKYLLLLAFVNDISGQYQIIQGTNYNAGDHSRQEVVDQNGNIRGQYSYIDPTGKNVLVRYTAGLNGFQVEPLTDPQPLTYPSTNTIDQPIQLPRSKYQGQFLFQPNRNRYTAPPATQKQFEAYQEALKDEINQSNGPANAITQDVTPAQFPKTLPPPQPVPRRPYVPQYGFVPGNLGFPVISPNNAYGELQSGLPNSQIVFNSNTYRNPVPRIPEYEVQYVRDATPINEESQGQYRIY